MSGIEATSKDNVNRCAKVSIGLAVVRAILTNRNENPMMIEYNSAAVYPFCNVDIVNPPVLSFERTVIVIAAA